MYPKMPFFNHSVTRILLGLSLNRVQIYLYWAVGRRKPFM